MWFHVSFYLGHYDLMSGDRDILGIPEGIFIHFLTSLLQNMHLNH